MPQVQEALLQRIQILEKELRAALAEKERTFRYRWVKGKATFDQDVAAHHHKLKFGLPSYILHSRILVLVTAPLIYLGAIPFLLLDIFLALFQGICFPIYNIPKVKRSD